MMTAKPEASDPRYQPVGNKQGCRICFQLTYHDIRCRLAKGLDSPVLPSERSAGDGYLTAFARTVAEITIATDELQRALDISRITSGPVAPPTTRTREEIARELAGRIAEMVGFDVDVQDANGTTVTSMIAPALTTAADEAWERAIELAESVKCLEGFSGHWQNGHTQAKTVIVGLLEAARKE